MGHTSRVAFLSISLLAAAASHGATIAAVTGPTYFTTGLGSGNGQQAAAMGFSTATPLAGVAIAAPISVVNFDTTLTAYLTTRLGAGTTVADVVAQASVKVPVNTASPNNYQFTPTTFFSGLSLPAGSYYLSLVETDGLNDAGVGLIFNGQQAVTLAPGVAFLGTYGTSRQTGTFAPGFSYSNNQAASLFAGDDAFSVTGTLLPEPATLAATGAAGLLAARRRRRRGA